MNRHYTVAEGIYAVYRHKIKQGLIEPSKEIYHDIAYAYVHHVFNTMDRTPPAEKRFYFTPRDIEYCLQTSHGLPDNCYIRGKLVIDDEKFTKLPKGLKVDGDMYIFSSGIAELPDDLIVKGSLFIHDQNIKLPRNFMVRGDLSIRSTYTDCKTTVELPDGLTVGGYLYIDGNATVETLPSNLVVLGDVGMSGKTTFTHIPEDTIILGKLLLGEDTQLKKYSKRNIKGGCSVMKKKDSTI